MNFCSRAAQASGAPLAGTGVRGDVYVFIPAPKQLWGESELNTGWASPSLIEEIKAARRAGVVTRLYEPGRRADAKVLVHRAPGLGSSAGLNSLLHALASRWEVDAGERPRLAICTHGTRDRCCAKFGFAVWKAAQKLFADGLSQFEPLECSHLGGDRFAATGVFFPTGSMYAHLDTADLPALIAAEGLQHVTPDLYRGRVFDSQLVQIVRAGLAREGLALHASEVIEVVGEVSPEGGEITAGIAGGARRFRVSLQPADARFFSSCEAMDRGRVSRGRRLAFAGAVEIDRP